MSIATYIQSIATALDALGYQASGLHDSTSDGIDRYDISFKTADETEMLSANTANRSYSIDIILSVACDEFLTSNSYAYVASVISAQQAIDAVSKDGLGTFTLCSIENIEKQTDISVILAQLTTTINISESINDCSI